MKMECFMLLVIQVSNSHKSPARRLPQVIERLSAIAQKRVHCGRVVQNSSAPTGGVPCPPRLLDGLLAAPKRCIFQSHSHRISGAPALLPPGYISRPPVLRLVRRPAPLEDDPQKITLDSGLIAEPSRQL